MGNELWNPANRIEERYKKDLEKLNDIIFSSISTLTDPFEITFILNQISKSSEFKQMAIKAARKMVTGKLLENQRTWRKAAMKSTQARRIYLALQKELGGAIGQTVFGKISENARFITQMPLDYARQITSHVAEQSFKGIRSGAIAQDIMAMFPGMSRHRANTIARTESSKAGTALNQARSEDMGLDWYVWRTSEDQRVRKSHSHMEGVLIRWSDPPSPEQLVGERSYGHYHSGCIFQCRCYSQPVLSLSDVQFPAKVYHNGTIQRMTQSKFLAIQ